jgi:hypothetical protein
MTNSEQNWKCEDIKNPQCMDIDVSNFLANNSELSSFIEHTFPELHQELLEQQKPQQSADQLFKAAVYNAIAEAVTDGPTTVTDAAVVLLAKTAELAAIEAMRDQQLWMQGQQQQSPTTVTDAAIALLAETVELTEDDAVCDQQLVMQRQLQHSKQQQSNTPIDTADSVWMQQQELQDNRSTELVDDYQSGVSGSLQQQRRKHKKQQQQKPQLSTITDTLYHQHPLHQESSRQEQQYNSNSIHQQQQQQLQHQHRQQQALVYPLQYQYQSQPTEVLGQNTPSINSVSKIDTIINSITTNNDSQYQQWAVEQDEQLMDINTIQHKNKNAIVTSITATILACRNAAALATPDMEQVIEKITGIWLSKRIVYPYAYCVSDSNTSCSFTLALMFATLDKNVNGHNSRNTLLRLRKNRKRLLKHYETFCRMYNINTDDNIQCIVMKFSFPIMCVEYDGRKIPITQPPTLRGSPVYLVRGPNACFFHTSMLGYKKIIQACSQLEF